MEKIDDELRAFIESDVVVFVATRDEHLAPEVSFGWAARVVGSHDVEICIDKPRADTSIANLKSNGRIAVTFTSAITARSLQLKGWCIGLDEPGPEEAERLDRHRQGFTESLRTRGLPAHVTRGYWCKDVVRVRFSVDEAYDQTPGPKAGGKL